MTTHVDFAGIRAKLATLKAAYPRKQGTRVFVRATYESFCRQSTGYVQWDGHTLASLLAAREELLSRSAPRHQVTVTLYLTHPAIAASEPAAKAAQVDITAELQVEPAKARAA